MHADNESGHPRSLFMKLFLKSYEYHHRRLFWGVRIVVGLALLAVGIGLFVDGSWWGLLALVGSAAAFVLGYRIYQLAGSTQAVGASGPAFQ